MCRSRHRQTWCSGAPHFSRCPGFPLTQPGMTVSSPFTANALQPARHLVPYQAAAARHQAVRCCCRAHTVRATATGAAVRAGAAGKCTYAQVYHTPWQELQHFDQKTATARAAVQLHTMVVRHHGTCALQEQQAMDRAAEVEWQYQALGTALRDWYHAQMAALCEEDHTRQAQRAAVVVEVLRHLQGSQVITFWTRSWGHLVRTPASSLKEPHHVEALA